MIRHSALYEGRVSHRRFGARPHAFSYRLCMLYLDLAELESVFAGRWLWSYNRANVASFRREDYLGPADRPLDRAVRERVGDETGASPAGPIRVLTHPRYLGYVFNPVSFYYCFDAADEGLEAIVAEVTNTPWKERHAYVLPTDPVDGREHAFRLSKRLHVSPFMPMDHTYHWRLGTPGPHLNVDMRNERQGERVFEATLRLTRRPLDTAGLARALIAYPLMTAKVTAAIHWEALRLWLAGHPVFVHPRKRASRCGA